MTKHRHWSNWQIMPMFAWLTISSFSDGEGQIQGSDSQSQGCGQTKRNPKPAHHTCTYRHARLQAGLNASTFLQGSHVRKQRQLSSQKQRLNSLAVQTHWNKCSSRRQVHRCYGGDISNICSKVMPFIYTHKQCLYINIYIKIYIYNYIIHIFM